MKKSATIWVALYLAAFNWVSAVEDPKILILNSYHISYKWAQEVLIGITDELESNGVQQPQMYSFFFDSIRITENTKREGKIRHFREEFGGMDFDLIITQDDYAFNVLKTCYEELFKGIPVIVCGVSSSVDIPEMLKPYTTGVFEGGQNGEILRIFQNTHPQLSELFIVHGANPSAVGMRDAFDAYLSENELEYTITFIDGRELSTEAIKDWIRRIEPTSERLLLSIGWKYGSEHPDLEDTNLHSWLAVNSPIPTYMFEFHRPTWPYDESLLSLVYVDGFLHGKRAAQQGLLVLNGVDPAKIPFINRMDRSFVYFESTLNRAKLPRFKLPENAIILRDDDSPKTVPIYWFLASVLGVVAIFVGIQQIHSKQRRAQYLRLEAEKDRLRSLFGGIKDIILVTEGDQIVDLNLAATEALGYISEELLSKRLSQITEKFGDRYVLKGAGDLSIDCEETHSEVNIGERQLTMNVFRDIRRRLRAESEVLLTKEKLEVSNIELQKALNLAQINEREARKANEAKSHFLANISHEIRSPLNVIIGLSESLEESIQDLNQKDLVRLVSKSGMHLLSVINDVLDFSKIEANELELENCVFELRKVLEDILDLFQLKASQKALGLNMVFDGRLPKYGVGDPSRVRQILINLIDNAIKFTAEGSVDLEARLMEETESEVDVELRVKDSGIGIDPELKETLFAPFQQMDTSISRKYGGTGLGLSISRRLVRMMGGEMSVESEEGTGSLFIFNLVIPKPKPHEISTDYEAAEKMRKVESKDCRALVVDDSSTNLIVAARLLEKIGLIVLTARDPQMAIRLMSDQHIDIIFMDLQMPEIDGFEATRMIKSGEFPLQNPDAPVIALTAHAMKGDREKCLAAGMADYISKPINLQKLKQIVGKYFKMRA